MGNCQKKGCKEEGDIPWVINAFYLFLCDEHTKFLNEFFGWIKE